MSVAIVGGYDAGVGALVRGAGAHVTVSWFADLAALTAPGVAAPDVVVIDLRGKDHVPASLPLLKMQHPSAGVIVLISVLDPALMLETMRAGVTECVAEPLVQGDLTAAFGRVAGQRGTSAPGAVFAFVGARGGVGTTTTAVNVATSLARLSPPRALLIDLHLAYGDAAVFLGAEARYSVQDAIANRHRLDDTFFRSLIVKTASTLDLLASSSRPPAAPVSAADLRAVIAFAAGTYAYTVLDVPRSDATALDCLDQASTLVVVANQELATVRNAGRMAAALRARYTGTRVMTVLSRPDREADIDQQDVERAVGGAIAHQFPSDYRRAVHAMNTGRPVMLDAQSALSAAFASLARDLAGLTSAKSARRPTGLMGLLSGRS